MKANLWVIVAWCTTWSAVADEPASKATTPPAPAEARPVAPAMPKIDPAPTTAPATPVPVVRLPVANANANAASSTATASPERSAVSAEIGWSGSSTGLRSSPSMSSRTNRSWETRGAVPRLVKPERRTFGGFVVGFANLFNPFAPGSQGVGGPETYWYDSQPNVAPLPRGFRDERSHEPTANLLSIPLERDPGVVEAKPTPPPAPAR